MPGIVGFSHASNSRLCPSDAIELIKKQRDLLRHADSYLQSMLYVDDRIAASRTSVGIVNPAQQPQSAGGWRVWLEGEILNRSEFGACAASSESDAALLARLVSQDMSMQFLDKLDGIFAAVAYHEDSGELHFLTDRHGLEFLYYTIVDDESLAWSSEVKGFFAHPDFRREIDERSIDDFMRDGHLHGDRTWLRDAKLFPPASHWVWDLNKKKFTQRRTYWSWDDLIPFDESEDVDELARESARLFRRSVAACDDRPNNRTGVLLSGGLDSRAILATMRDEAVPITTFTYGMPTSSDVRLAARVARIKHAEHVVRPITDANWSKYREQFVWWLDGQLDMLHMQYASFAPEIRQHFDVNLSGYLGDATIGGSYLVPAGSSETERIVHRGRRFIGCGLQQGKIFTHERAPFFNTDFLTHCMRVPAALRKDSRFYFRMLKHLLPEPYHAIPWQSSGLTIRQPAQLHNGARFAGRALNRVKKTIGWNPNPRDFINSKGWLRSESGHRFIQNHFRDDGPLCFDLRSFDRQQQLRSLIEKSQLSSKDIAFVFRCLTLELWLRQMHTCQAGPMLAESPA